MQLAVGDRVSMSPMWKYKKATGVIIKITKEYTVVKWEESLGEWHYTHAQAKKLVKIE